MADELMLQDNCFRPTANGLIISGEPGYDVWEKYGQKLRFVEGAIQWLIGDWLNYGELHYGEISSQALESGNSPQTWMNCKFVASKFEIYRRREVLSFSHHSEVANLDPEEADQLLLQAEEKQLTRQELRIIVRSIRQMNTPEFPDDKYRVIYADPPWTYNDDQHGRLAQLTVLGDHYESMSIQELCDLPVKNLAQENSVLFIWVTSPLLRECFEVIDAWGFEYKASIIWDKQAHNVGYYVSVRHEFLLICTRGSCRPDIDHLLPSVVSEMRTEHSVKPEKFRQMIDTMYPQGKRIELFARVQVPNWARWGNECL